MRHNQRELRIFVKNLDVLPFGTDGAEHYGTICLLFAAHARSIDALLHA